ncbi:GtrA family protein [Nocardioides sp. cx-173]|uniref:GtrA family protein n=1 Tax=Nocardioides sp. cx-173 TaxID=2898796 RepID=UPI001E557D48|nr:GtrA family protein [Nocardioides sp. cx-173]MCD4525565.1 GtrA family protein [Nocardioides sp. cx-173]UGB42709.1 GtrA family protein [Nocardioides sp. cx-173]
MRFAAVGVANTLIDVVLFMLLHDRLGILAANCVSTIAGMTFSFVVNGLFTFRADRLTLRHAALFLATNAVTLWMVQPLVIHGLLALLEDVVGPDDLLVLGAKLVAIGVSFVLNFVAYRFVVWPAAGTREADRTGSVSSDPRP